MITGKAITKENQDALHEQLQFINIFLGVFALIALVVGSFIIYNTFSIVVAQRTREMALLRAIGASRAPGAAPGARRVGASSALIASIDRRSSRASLLAIGLKAAMSAIGFDLPGSASSSRASAIVIGLHRRHRHHRRSRRSCPRWQAARVPPDRGDARRRRSSARPDAALRLGIGVALLALGVVAAVRRRFRQRRQRHRVRRPRRALVFVGVVRARPAVRARSRAWRSARRSRDQGHHRHARPRERGPQPEAHRDDRDRADHRRRARRVHHDLRGVGQGVGEPRDRPAVQDRLHHHGRAAASAPAVSVPTSAEQIARAAGDPGVDRVARRQRRDRRQPHVPHRGRPDARRRSSFDFTDVAGHVDLARTTTASRSRRRRPTTTTGSSATP